MLPARALIRSSLVAMITSLCLVTVPTPVSAQEDATGPLDGMVFVGKIGTKGNPRLESINAIMRALGYYLTPQKLENLT